LTKYKPRSILERGFLQEKPRSNSFADHEQ
jgi:hypothetical protein